MTNNNKLISINNGRDFNIPIDDRVMSRPIGTYQYTDAEGELHIVNFINDPNGLRILNDYKPYERLGRKNKSKPIESNDPKTEGNIESDGRVVSNVFIAQWPTVKSRVIKVWSKRRTLSLIMTNMSSLLCRKRLINLWIETETK